MKIKLMKLLIILVLLQSQAYANSTVNFSGTWQLDLHASDSIDAILKAQGKSRFERRIARSMKVTQTIYHQQNSLRVHMKSQAVDDTHVFLLNNQWQNINTAKMGTIPARSHYTQDNLGIETQMNIMANGQPATLISIRTLSPERNTMFLDLKLKLNNGDVHTARRVFQEF